MTGPELTLLAVAVLLVPTGGTLAALDAALSRVSVARVEELVREDVRGAHRLSQVLAERARHTNLLLLLRVAAELTATVFVTAAATSIWGTDWWVVLCAILVMVVVSYVLIGVGPRTLGRQHAYRVALLGAGPVLLLGRLFGPLASLLILLGNAITPGRGYREGPFSSEVEIRELVDLAESRGVVERGEREMIQSVFDLGDTIAREVMVPRTEVVWIESTKNVPQALALALRSGFSRIPVVADNVDDVVGLVHLKDLVRRAQDPERARQTKLDEVMRPATFVPESKQVDELLREMQSRNSHMAIVIDEYGGTAGLITIEDILEEIVGEIRDEFDVEQAPVEELADGSYRLTARLPVEDLGELFGVQLPRGDDVETVGGLLAQQLGRVPIAGSSVNAYGLELTAESVGGRRNRIDTVLARKLDEPGAGEGDDD
ncbi:MAG TPA: hemolysin family protein [Jatrophihabitans sp.]|nr:hemolysin family protein [Jatrophihabitans sp.]